VRGTCESCKREVCLKDEFLKGECVMDETERYGMGVES
jgi:hypothetical protein